MERTDYHNLSPKTLAAIRATSKDVKVRLAIRAEFQRRGIWTY